MSKRKSFLLILIAFIGSAFFSNYFIIEERHFVEGDYQSIIEKAGTEIVIITATSCGVCKKLKEFLQESKLDYKEYNIQVEDEARLIFSKFETSSVPILITKDTAMIGYSENVLKGFLDEQK